MLQRLLDLFRITIIAVDDNQNLCRRFCTHCAHTIARWRGKSAFCVSEHGQVGYVKLSASDGLIRFFRPAQTEIDRIAHDFFAIQHGGRTAAG